MKLLFERLAQLEKYKFSKEHQEAFDKLEEHLKLCKEKYCLTCWNYAAGKIVGERKGELEGLRFALKVFEEQKKDWFQILKDNNQYDDFIKFYGDLWEEIFGKDE